jgi:hypothetical protein
MKSKLFKVLGVVAVVAMLATALVAPIAAMSGVSVSVATGTAIINAVGNYTITATLGAQLLGTNGITVPFAASGSTLTVTAVNAYDMVKVAFTGATPTVAPTGTGHYAAGVVSFTSTTGTVTFTTQAANTAITYTETAGSAALVTNTGGGTTSTAPNGDSITLTLPAGFTISTPAGLVTSPTDGLVAIPGTTGFPSPIYEASQLSTTPPKFSYSGQNVIITLGAGDYIGNGALVYINLTAGVANPTIAGNYTLTMMTSQETTPVTSNVFTISNPVITPLPGVASVYNTAGVLMSQSNSLTTAIGYVNTNLLAGAVIKLTAGTYPDPIGSNVALTIQGTDANAANVVIQGTGSWYLTGLTVVVDKVTIDGTNGGYLTVNAATTGSGTVSNSIIQNGALTMSATGTATSNVTNDTFTVATGSVGLIVNAATTITGSTFNVAGTGEGISGNANVTASGSTFNGVTGGGVGVELVNGAASVIGTSKFSGLTEALDVQAPAAVSFNNNTVDKCGVATTGPDAIMIHSTNPAGTGVLISGNKITNSLENIITVAANDNLVFVMGNSFTGNTGIAADTTATGTGLNMTHNYWGGTAANPADTTTAPIISFDHPLGSAPVAGIIGVGSLSLDTSATAGVVITGATNLTAQEVLGAFILSGNPVTTALPSIVTSAVTAKSYYDVFGIGTTSTTVLAALQFNGSTAKPIGANDEVFYWDPVMGQWDIVSSSANAYSNWVQVTGANITGSIFALASTVPIIAAPSPSPTIQYPATGATGIPINVTFAWPAVTGATGYQFAIAQDNPDLANKFAVLDYSANTITNAHIVQETLLYNTTYWWEVRSVNGNVTSPWTVISFFTTEAAPVTTTSTTAPPITVTNTTVTYTNPQATTITYTLPQPKETQPIPSYLLWAVIAVGAVLVIAVIVLIVRTRRMP